MSTLIETLAQELELAREVPERVSDHIWSKYEIERESVGDFLKTGLTDLEEYEQELILAPMFTPNLTDQAVFAELLGKESIPKTEWPALVEQLTARPAYAQLVTNDKGFHKITLPEIILERYIYRLRLDGSISDPLWLLLEQKAFAADHQTFRAIARRPIWESDARCNILTTYLTLAGHNNIYQLGDGGLLLAFVEDFKPKDVAGFTQRILQRQEALRQEIETAGDPKPFFSAEIQNNHGFGRDQRQQDENRVAEMRDALVFLDRLHQVFWADSDTES